MYDIEIPWKKEIQDVTIIPTGWRLMLPEEVIGNNDYYFDIYFKKWMNSCSYGQKPKDHPQLVYITKKNQDAK